VVLKLEGLYIYKYIYIIIYRNTILYGVNPSNSPLEGFNEGSGKNSEKSPQGFKSLEGFILKAIIRFGPRLYDRCHEMVDWVSSHRSIG